MSLVYSYIFKYYFLAPCPYNAVWILAYLIQCHHFFFYGFCNLQYNSSCPWFLRFFTTFSLYHNQSHAKWSFFPYQSNCYLVLMSFEVHSGLQSSEVYYCYMLMFMCTSSCSLFVLILYSEYRLNRRTARSESALMFLMFSSMHVLVLSSRMEVLCKWYLGAWFSGRYIVLSFCLMNWYNSSFFPFIWHCFFLPNALN